MQRQGSPTHHDSSTTTPSEPAENAWQPQDLAYVPLYSPQERVIGAISMGGPADQRRPDEECFQYLELFADLAARVIENIRLSVQRRRVEEALQESEVHYKELFDSAMEGIGLVDQNEVIRLCNPAYVDILEEDSAAKLLGKSLWHYIPDDQKDTLAAQTALRKRGIYSQYELGIVTAKGNRKTILVSVSPRFDEGNEYIGAFGLFLDITNRKQAEQKLRFLSLIAEQVSDSVVATNLDFQITYTNQSFHRLYGYSRDEILGRTPRKLNAEPGADRIQDDIYRTVTSGGTWRGELLNRRKDGSTFPCDSMIFPLVGEDGTVFAYAGLQRDITRRKQAEERRVALEAQMRHAQKLESLGILAGGIAHDFNNLLVSILGNTNLALAKLPPESPARSLIQFIDQAGQRAAELTNQMLAYSGKGKFVIEPIDLPKLVEEMTHLLDASISKQAELKYEFPDDFPPVEADATQLRQVVMNLITNASDALGDSAGVITVRAGVTHVDRAHLLTTHLGNELEEGPYAFIEVADTGCGMDAAARDKMFDPFFTTKFTGRGLGLAAVQGIVRGHRGAIKVKSEPGKGTTFRVLLPVSQRPVTPGSDESRPSTDARRTGTVLVVDDEDMVRTAIKMTLEQSGFAVLCAADGQEALDVFREHNSEIDVVLLDMTMPHLSGEEVFREMRQVQADVRVVLSSGFSESEATERFAGTGLAGFIQKPFVPDVLVEKLSKVMRAH